VALSPAEEPVCVVTRITFPGWLSLPGGLVRFRKLRRMARRIPGLVETHVRVRGNATLLIVSVWENQLALLRFTTLDEHSNAIRWTIRKQAKVWSGVFRLAGTSSMSKPWIGTVRHWEPLAPSEQERVAVDDS
jgi:hypothetical protein